MPKKLFVAYGVSLFLIVFGVAYVAFNTRELGGVLVTHYDLVRGVDFLGRRNDFYSILLGLFLLSGFNFLISLELYSRMRFLAYGVAWITILLNIIGLYGIMYLISLNI
ncbi:MAG: hypothetical protein KGI50_02680 [Patescibacteria group bacterium]|nr:hypothetical protein [Patescibacteria group bacterium]MDE2438581.1 hypothetical protein [Patescibacteria group bacterium]